ncbi:MAG: response regulator [Bdellovibrionaceae bacterium]|nr:response regulator [Pseudobdellovibrionaceae bacterium]
MTEIRHRGVDITDCDREPIHIPGSIQSHGILLALRYPDMTILQVSASVFDLVGVRPEELLLQPLGKLLDTEIVDRAAKRLGERSPRLLNPIPIEIKANGQSHHFDGILHRSGRTLILELEKHVAHGQRVTGFGGFYEAIREVISKIMATESLQDVFDSTCEELQRFTGFSRILIYKFDDEWNGNVLAEANDGQFDSLMHHRFPASDIPKQARELYSTNWLRLIPDVHYKPAPIVPPNNPLTDKPIDLSNSVLRSVSPVHVEYMKNLGQGASMSISLLKGRKLWGLISCHHREPLFLNYEKRVASEFIGQMVSAQIVAREDAMNTDHRLQLKIIYDDLLRKGGSFGDLAATLRANSGNLLALADASGAAICLGRGCTLIGETPSEEQCNRIRAWVHARNEEIMATDSLGTLMPQAKEFSDKASGLLAITIPGPNNSAILWFRPQQRESIAWAGNPNESKYQDADGVLHPRRSFASWLESVEGRSCRWKEAEITVVGEFRAAIIGMALREKAGPVRQDEAHDFRHSLAQSMAASAASKESREIPKDQVERPSTTEQAARNSKFLLEGFAEFAVLLVGLDGRIQSWSAGAARLTGFNQADAMGRGLDLFFADEEIQREKHQRVLSHVRLHGRCEEEMWLYRADGSSFWGKIMVSQVRNDRNEPIGYSIVLQDITKEKAAEEELKATKFAAEAANQAKTAFLANISHEIRTPLGAILGFAELMDLDSQTSEERHSLYARVKKNGEQLTILINDLLDLAKVEAGKIEVELLEVDLPGFLLDIQNSLGIKASEKSVSFEVQVEGALPVKITTDPTRLRQILVNKISNAIKFTERGGEVRLIASMGSPDRPDRLFFRVTDTGRGMTEDEMSRLFKPFVQADASTTRKYGGTGLGLFVSQRLAKSLRGDLIIESSSRGKGSTFLTSIDPGPVEGQPTFQKLTKKPMAPKQTRVEDKDLFGLRILLVDDSPDNRHLIKLYLNKAGATVESAADGVEGVDLALNQGFDVVLMDIQMPNLDGNAAMQKLRMARYTVPVIALTAHAMAEERERSLEHGFSDYLTKPINRDLLVETIVRHVHLRYKK